MREGVLGYARNVTAFFAEPIHGLAGPNANKARRTFTWPLFSLRL